MSELGLVAVCVCVCVKGDHTGRPKEEGTRGGRKENDKNGMRVIEN